MKKVCEINNVKKFLKLLLTKEFICNKLQKYKEKENSDI